MQPTERMWVRTKHIFSEDETTGINTVENTQSTIENTAVYNLNGQRIVKPTKGLYIQNGKKYIVK